MSTPFVEFLKGDAGRLDGRLTVLARITGPLPEDQPAAAMIQGGLLSVQGNYRDQRTMADFFRDELGLTMEKGIEEIIQQAQQNGGIESALDPDAVRERLRSMGRSEFLPIPAKVVGFPSMEEALREEGDVVFLGSFEDLQFAHMAVNGFPMLYQARYREQEHGQMRQEIEQWLEKIQTVEDSLPPPDSPATLETFEGDIESHLLKDLLPGMFYAEGGTPEAHAAELRFRAFMAPCLVPQDVENMIELVPSIRRGDMAALHRLELLVRKAAALHREDFRTLEKIKHELGE
ncbi:MAG: hypothetical protein H6686_10175 [Fibrobacteria bacterium]|nr:hypothetical protein [Fibrobacteria bacterium]